jgi:predicted dienelactone hydrolase
VLHSAGGFTALVVAGGAGHLSFIAPCDKAEAAVAARAADAGSLNWCADPDGFDRAAFHKAFNSAVVDFFSRVLAPRAPRR